MNKIREVSFIIGEMLEASCEGKIICFNPPNSFEEAISWSIKKLEFLLSFRSISDLGNAPFGGASCGLCCYMVSKKKHNESVCERCIVRREFGGSHCFGSPYEKMVISVKAGDTKNFKIATKQLLSFFEEIKEGKMGSFSSLEEEINGSC